MWLPAGDNPQRIDMLAYMNSMRNEAGKFELSKSPETAEIRRYSKKMVSQLSRELSKIDAILAIIVLRRSADPSDAIDRRPLFYPIAGPGSRIAGRIARHRRAG